MPLTDAKVRNAKPKAKPYKLSDGHGLYLEVMPTGSRLWRAKYRIHGKERRISFGAYLPDGKGVSLAEAREKCTAARALKRDGVDPVQARRQERTDAATEARDTLRRLAAEWLANEARQKGWTADYQHDVERSLELYVYPKLGNQPVRSITPRELIDTLNAVLDTKDAKGKKPGARLETVRRLRQRLDGIFTYALLCERLDTNPAHGLRRAFTAPKATPMPALLESELPGLLAKVAERGQGSLIEGGVWLLCLTAVRTGELRAAQWSEIDWEQRLWRIPAERMKKRREHLVPLSTQALDILARLRERTGHTAYLFPHRSDDTRHLSENSILYAIWRAGFKGRASGHGFRSTFSTAANEHGKPADVVEAILAHVSTNKTRAAYNRALYLEQRRQVLQWWADRIDAMTTQQSAKVLTFPEPERASA